MFRQALWVFFHADLYRGIIGSLPRSSLIALKKKEHGNPDGNFLIHEMVILNIDRRLGAK